MEIVKYTPDKKKEWDSFVKKAKNSHFFFYKDYMEYHSDRFNDFSLMVYHDNKLISLFPANIKDNIIYSHGGLTFGGFITDNSMNTTLMLNIFQEFINFCKKEHIKEVYYKCMPYIYHLMAAEEDRYALFINNALLYRRDVTTTIYLDKVISYQERRKRSIKKAKTYNLEVIKSESYEEYWKVLTENLVKKYNTKPVHTVDEIKYLHSLFPDNINLYVTLYNSEIVAGVVLFINEDIIHCQYIASSDLGKEMGALDILFDTLINKYKGVKKYFDFGISNEKDGRYLNEGLIQYKEGFGARAVCHDFYRIVI